MDQVKKAADWVDMDSDLAKELIGFRTELKEGETGTTFIDENGARRKFVLDKNRSNRPFKLTLANRYAERFLRGEWAGQWRHPSNTDNGESWTFDWEGQAISCAHRAAGLILAQARRDFLADIGSPEIEEYSIPEKITVPVLLVTGLDPASADTADTGKGRSLGDVLFRRHSFANGEQIPESTKVVLNRELATAIRLVWLRLRGEQVSRSGKFDFPEALSFSETHPLICDCLLHVYKWDTSKKHISSLISLGYAAALMYLSAFSEELREQFEDGSLDPSQEPKNWEAAKEFWTLFSKFTAKDAAMKDGPAVGALHSILVRNKLSQDNKFSRDAVCSVVARAWLGFLGETQFTTAKGIERLLFIKDGEKTVLDLQRFGGLDLPKEALLEHGWIKEETAEVRIKKSQWKVGDLVWVKQFPKQPAWYAEIVTFSEDGEKAAVKSLEEEDKGSEFAVLTKWFRRDKPAFVPKPPKKGLQQEEETDANMPADKATTEAGAKKPPKKNGKKPAKPSAMPATI